MESRNEETRLDFANGYKFTPLVSFWSGFTWISPNDGNAQIYRPWQQVIWEILDKNPVIVISNPDPNRRTQTAKDNPNGDGNCGNAGELHSLLESPKKFTPVLYDEIFFNLNQPVWVRTRHCRSKPGFYRRGFATHGKILFRDRLY